MKQDTGRLTYTLLLHLQKEGRLQPRVISSPEPPLLYVIRWIYFLTIDQRKFLIEVYRIQQPILLNSTLLIAYEKLLDTTVVNYITGETIKFSVLQPYLDGISLFDTLSSLLCYFARAEEFYLVEDALKEKDKSLVKEMTAALTLLPSDQKLDYSILFTECAQEPVHANCDVVPVNLRYLFKRGILQMSRHYSSSSKSRPLYPYVSDTKNVGYETQARFHRAVGSTSASPDITTGDLLRLYYRSGIQVGGPLEVRQWWKYNDLKPRTYYALGGDCYWSSLFIKEVANRVAEFLPSTNPFTRLDITRLGSVASEQLLVTYDYTSFTTSLSELRHFLYWLAKAFVGVPVDVIDVRHGVRTLDLGAMIDSYNSAINIMQEVDLQRLLPLTNENTVYCQMNSGSLGAPGNIVFSTCNHGVSLAGITDNPSCESCVGDDALTLVLKTCYSMFICHTNDLGAIEHTKFSSILRSPVDAPTQAVATAFKYLKRPLSVDFLGNIHTGTLDFFPSFAEALFPEGDGVHSGDKDSSCFDRAKTFVMQWGRFLHDLKSHPPTCLSDHDIDILLSCAQLVYDRFGISREGQLPGDTIIGDCGLEEFDAWCPPCDTELVFTSDWLESLCYRFRGQTVHHQLRVRGEVIPPTAARAGDEFECTACPPVSLLNTLRLIKMVPNLVERLVDESLAVEMKEVLFPDKRNRQMGLEVLYTVTILEVPSWYTDLVAFYHPILYPRDILEEEAAERSIFGGTLYSYY